MRNLIRIVVIHQEPTANPIENNVCGSTGTNPIQEFPVEQDRTTALAIVFKLDRSRARLAEAGPLRAGPK
jgi:hypothetical protein